MSLLDLFKKSNSSPAPSPISKYDEKLPPLPPLPPPVGVKPSAPAPAPGTPLPALPPMKPTSSLPPLPKVEPRPAAPALPPLPPMPAAKPALPPLPSVAPAPAAKPALPPLPPTPVAPKLGDMPKISVQPLPPVPAVKPAAPALPPMPPELPATPAVAPAPAPQPVKHENSRLAKALEELTTADFELETPKQVAKVVGAPARTHPAPLPVMPRAGPHQKFISMETFDDALAELREVQQDLMEVQANNERLGLLENQKKNSYDSIVSTFEHVQRQLLVIDEKLFKVN